VKDAGRMAAPHAWRRCRRRFDANFASPAYLIETDVCYRSSCGADLEFPIRAATLPRQRGSWRIAAPRCGNSPDRNRLLTTLRNRRYIAGLSERF